MKTKFNKLVVFILCVIFSTTIASNSKTQVYVVPIHDTIDLGIPAFVNRAINAAEKLYDIWSDNWCYKRSRYER